MQALNLVEQKEENVYRPAAELANLEAVFDVGRDALVKLTET